MATTQSAESIREYVAQHYIEPARRAGEHRVRVIAGDVHRSLGLKNRVPSVCQVLASRKFCAKNHVVIEDKAGPPSGMGTRMVFVYRLEDVVSPPRSVPSFEQLRGLLRDALKPLGGGEVFMRRELRNFYGSGGENEK